MFNSKESVINAFNTKYEYFSENEVEWICGTAISTYLDLRFPVDRSVAVIPSNDVRAWQWVFDCMGEIAERNGCVSMTAYRENGMSMSFDSSRISKGLANRIVPKVGLPR